MEKKINNDLAIVVSQYLEGRFMTNLSNWIVCECIVFFIFLVV